MEMWPGIEYRLLSFALLMSGGALSGVLLLLINGETDIAVAALPLSVLLVGVPLALVLSLLIERHERREPELRNSQSKLRSARFARIVSIVVCALAVMGFVYALFLWFGGQQDVSIGKTALDVLAVIGVAGAILAYYWRDDAMAGWQG